MKLKTARTQNYKCVEDSGVFSLSQVTCLVGKNESGKSAIVESLYRLKPLDGEKFDVELDFPRRHMIAVGQADNSNANVLTTHWELSADDVKTVEAKIGEGCLKSREVQIVKGYDNQRRYTVSIDEKAIVNGQLKAHGLDNDQNETLRKASQISELAGLLGKIEAPTEGQTQCLKSIKALFPNSPTISVITAIDELLPTFLYFPEYYKMPGRVSLEELAKKKTQGKLTHDDKVFIALLDLAGSTPEDIQKMTRFEPFIAKLEGISVHIGNEIFEYWSQNKDLEVVFRADPGKAEDEPPYNAGFVFRTRIKNTRHKATVSFDERSTGFIWFFSFLIWFSQVKRHYGENLVILLDEPGLNLHAKAQSDLLRYFEEKLKPFHQLVYTTHSPFMIDPENITGARTVEDATGSKGEILGTKVGDEVLSTDADTVFPLQAALGYEITQTLFVGKHTLLVEGPSDLLYLKWMSNELKALGKVSLDPRWTITPAGGIDKISSFMALFGGNKLDVAVLTDIFSGAKKKVEDLRKSKLLKSGRVFSADMYSGQADADIEDIIGRATYIALVNQAFGLKGADLIPAVAPAGAPLRAVKEVEAHFATLKPGSPNFDHFEPSAFLMEKGKEIKGGLPNLTEALERFEKLFKDLNAVL